MNPTGERYRIEAGGYVATCAEAGGALTSLHHGDRAVAGSTPDGEVISGGRGQILMPWPNRLRDGAYRFGGSSYQLGLSEPKTHNASHGLVRWCSWRPLEQRKDAVTLGYRLMAQSGYPWTLDLTVGYRVGEDGLTVTLGAVNRSTSPAPFAAGMHPYLDAGAPLDECTLTLPAGVHLDVDDRMLPVGTSTVSGDRDFRSGRSLRGVSLDDGFTDLAREAGRTVVRLAGPAYAVELWLDDAWTWLQAFTGDALPEPREALAVEPMTAPPDAFNSGTNLIPLDPGASWTGRFGLRLA